MPENIEKNGLPFHINGSFALRDDRTDFKWPSHDSMHDNSAKWNQCMVNEVLNLTLIQMIQHAKSVINKDISLKDFYALFPHVENIGLNWRENYLIEYFKQLEMSDLILSKTNQWIHLNKALLFDEIECKIEAFCKNSSLESTQVNCILGIVLSLFDSNHVPLNNVPKNIRDLYTFQQHVTLNLVGIDLICAKLKNISINKSSKKNLLNFIMQNVDSLAQLDNLDLIPLADKTWTKFIANYSGSDYIYFYIDSDPELKEFFYSNRNLCKILLDESFLERKTGQKLIELLSNQENHSQLRIYNNSSDFVNFLSKMIDETNNAPVNQEILSRAWSFISKYFSNQIELFENLKLVPFQNSFMSLKDGVNCEFKRYFYTDQSNMNISISTIHFFKQCGIFTKNKTDQIGCFIFDYLNLPAGLSKHSQFGKYFKPFCLIDALILLNRCLKALNKITLIDYLNVQTNEFKSNLLDDLNTTIKYGLNKTQNEAEFRQLALNDLPIFKVFDQSKKLKWTTAVNCLFSIAPSILKAAGNLPLDPQLRLIDLSMDEFKHLVQFLNLKEFPFDQLLRKSIDYYQLANDFSSIKLLIDWCQRNNYAKSIDLFNLKVFRNESNTKWLYLSEIYDPSNAFVQVFIPSSLHLHKDFVQIDHIYTALKPYLCTQIQLEYFESYIAQNLTQFNTNKREEYFTKMKFILEFLQQQQQTEKNKFMNSILKYECILAVSDNKLHKLNNLWSNEVSDLVGLVKPIIDPFFNQYNEFMKFVQMNFTLDDLIDNSHQLVYVQNRVDKIVIDKIYEKFSSYPNQNELKQKLMNRSFNLVYDGVDSYRLNSTIILNSSISDLSPYYFVVHKESNKFIQNYKNVYLNLFNIKQELSFDLLLDLINEKLSNETLDLSLSDLKTVNLIRSIYNLIEEMFDQQQNKDSPNELNNLLLPVYDHQNVNLFKFELKDKCVYLNDDENDPNDSLLQVICNF
jgi:hypothetical protein